MNDRREKLFAAALAAISILWCAALALAGELAPALEALCGE